MRAVVVSALAGSVLAGSGDRPCMVGDDVLKVCPEAKFGDATKFYSRATKQDGNPGYNYEFQGVSAHYDQQEGTGMLLGDYEECFSAFLGNPALGDPRPSYNNDYETAGFSYCVNVAHTSQYSTRCAELAGDEAKVEFISTENKWAKDGSTVLYGKPSDAEHYYLPNANGTGWIGPQKFDEDHDRSDEFVMYGCRPSDWVLLSQHMPPEGADYSDYLNPPDEAYDTLMNSDAARTTLTAQEYASVAKKIYYEPVGAAKDPNDPRNRYAIFDAADVFGAELPSSFKKANDDKDITGNPEFGKVTRLATLLRESLFVMQKASGIVDATRSDDNELIVEKTIDEQCLPSGESNSYKGSLSSQCSSGAGWDFKPGKYRENIKENEGQEQSLFSAVNYRFYCRGDYYKVVEKQPGSAQDFKLYRFAQKTCGLGDVDRVEDCRSQVLACPAASLMGSLIALFAAFVGRLCFDVTL